MLHNYLVTALRAFARRKLYSFINVVGLAVGLACAILIGLYVQQEVSFDRWLPERARIYRIGIELHVPGQPRDDTGSSSAPLGPTMKAEIPGIAEQARISSSGGTIIVGGAPHWSWINAVDGNFFAMIRLPFVRGDAASALAAPDGVVLTESAARRFFGTADAVGRTMLFDGGVLRRVSAILRDLPYNTQFAGDVFVRYRERPLNAPNGGAPWDDPQKWTTFNVSTYVRLDPGVDPNAIATQIPQLYLRHIPTAMLGAIASILPGKPSDLIKAKLVPLTDVHLTANVQGSGMKAPASRTLVYAMAAIALLILMVAGFNYTNLATAQAHLRSREVSLRKTIGATRRQIMTQFFVEAELTAIAALTIALALVEVALPAYGAFLGHPIALYAPGNALFLAGIVAVALICGLAGGFYPALVLSSFRPAAVMRGGGEPRRSGRLRTILVVLQFAVSIGLGIVTIVIFAQTRFAHRLDLGFDRDNVAVLSTSHASLPQTTTESLLRQLSADPNVAAAALSNKVPSETSLPMNIVRIPGEAARISVQAIAVSPEFSDVYGLKRIAGRFLSRNHGIDEHHGIAIEPGRTIVIDERAARAFGFTPETAIGKTVEMIGGRETIVGVVRDVLFNGAQAVPVGPVAYYFNPGVTDHISVRLRGGRLPQAMAAIDAAWKRTVPDKAIVCWFVDERLNALYVEDERQGALMSLFVAVAIFIASLGLFGLAAFTVARRTKEIGIRKVFGASTPSLIWLLMWQFSQPVLIANLIAWPAAWLYLRHWLNGFAYRIDLGFGTFALAGLAALLIAWTTVAVHAALVARANPIQALRYE